MDEFADGRLLGEQAFSRLSMERIIETARYFGTLSRQSGTEDGERAAEYIISEMRRAGVNVTSDRVECLASIPEETEIAVGPDAALRIPAYTECWSGVAENVTGQLVYDPMGEERALTCRQERDRLCGLSGKIVLTESFDTDFYRRLKNIGALGIILIRPLDIDYPMLFGTTGIWGVPVPETLEYLDCLPTVVVTAKNGERLRSLLRERAEPVTVNFSARANNGLFTFTQPSAYIPGSSDNYVLVAAHYDGWFRSVIDNAVAVGFTMELARVLQKMRPQLRRGVRFLWLAGHENVPYAGSTYYVDRYFEDLRQHCAAYINIDVIGGKLDPARFFINTTRMEGEDFADGLAEEINGKRPTEYMPMVRAADQSLWGVEVPLCLMANGGDPGWWYHTAADTAEQLDPDVLRRDARFYAHLILRIANSVQLPVDMPCFLKEAERFLEGTWMNSDAAFDFSPMFDALHAAQKKVGELLSVLDKKPEINRDGIYMRLAGELARICYIDSDNYTYNILSGGMARKPNGGTTFVEGVTRENCCPEDYLCIMTKFIRLRNRYVNELRRLCEHMDYLMLLES